ncbi:LacI family DNA-binding transcriptional regulator [Algisphaera agarilytica]|uniref:LacI family transcriptional regulator n=1 Tax=Algisphaera agarilytica TaxID=1385975 RepID=A0A7X0H793_9BACT|nr:LacI family DNA-binding transcriptional regulator [Algisphaera agarilytica]MBB6429129.1 LacI family transcriptional regulator [Algisphaera agarilytica]
MSEKVGIKEVAERCGVSKSAVSLVINNRRGVSDQTRDRIRKAIKDLGFRPNTAARRLGGRDSQGEIGQYGFLAFDAWADSSHSYYGQVLAGASIHAQKLGARLSFFQVPEPDTAGKLPPQVNLDALDGCLITGRPSLEILRSISKSSKPTVMVSPSTPHVVADSVRPENIEGSWLATRHLIELGHSRIAFLGGNVDNVDAQERYLGYRMAVQEAGIELDEDLVEFQDFSPPGGRTALANVLSRSSGVTAVFAGGDYLAIGAYDAAHDAGLEIPGDLSIVGFDDIEPVRYLRPALTTIHIDLHAIGAHAFDRVLQLIDKPQPLVHLRVPGKLVQRDSTRVKE